jgi:hypothetical protein
LHSLKVVNVQNLNVVSFQLTNRFAKVSHIDFQS